MRFSSLVLLSTVFCGAVTAHADIAWERDYETALTKSRASGKPLFIDFYTTWCGWCKKLDADVFPDAQVQRLSRSFVMLKLNAEREGASAARALSVRGYPTLLVVPPGGQPTKVGGYIPAARFAAMMQQVLQSVPKPTASQNTDFSANLPKWQNQIKSHSMKNSKNYGGVFLLDENGVVALNVPAKKTQKPVKSPVKTAKKPQKMLGY